MNVIRLPLDDNDQAAMTSNFFCNPDRKILPSYRSFPVSVQLLTMLAVALLMAASGKELYAIQTKGQFNTAGPVGDSKHDSQAVPTVSMSKGSSWRFFVSSTVPQDRERWLEGGDFEKKLKDIQSVQWERASLRQIVSDAERTYQLRIWMDRRVDTSQIVNLKLNSISVGQSLSELAKACQSEVVFMSPLVIVVPEGTSAQFLALRANLSFQLEKLPTPLRRPFLEKTSVEWNRFEQPNNLLRQWISPLSESLVGLDSLPHDAWAEGELPELALVDRLLLLSFGFAKQFQIVNDKDGLNLKLMEMDADSDIDCLIENKDWIQRLQTQQSTFKQQFPDVQWTTKQGKRMLSGKLDEVASVLRLALQPVESVVKNQDLTRQRFTLSVSQQVAGNILQTIAEQTKITMVIDTQAKTALQRRIDLNARDLTLEQLLDQVAQATETKITLQGTQMVVSGKK